MAADYAYVGFFLVVASLADPLLDRPRVAPALYAFGLGVLILLSIRTLRRNADWKDSLTLWSKTVQDAPQVARARVNLGAQYLERGQVALAEEQFDAALKIKPNYATAYSNLGRIYLERNDLVRAEQALTKAIRRKRDQTVLHLWLGEVFLRTGRLAEAEEQFRVALSDPQYEAYTYNKLGALFARSGRLSEAEGAFKEAARRKPTWAEPRENLARLYQAQKHNGRAGKPMKGALP